MVWIGIISIEHGRLEGCLEVRNGLGILFDVGKSRLHNKLLAFQKYHQSVELLDIC
jgi:hypothetical protein